MKKPLLFSFLFILLTGLEAYSQTINTEWAAAVGGSASDFGNSITVDGTGNVFSTGTFQGTVVTPLGTFVSNGGTDIYIVAQNSAGTVSWALQIGGGGADAARSIVTDASGNVYVTGSFTGTVDFDPGPGGPFTAAGGAADVDIFVAKFDATTGALIWAKQMGGTGTDEGLGIALDPTGNVYTTGYFNGTSNFDPNGTANLTSAGSLDIFVSKLDATGAYVWASAMGGTSADFGVGIKVDADGNVVSTGLFAGTADLDPGAGSLNFTATANDSYVSKLSGATGALVWAQQITGANNEQANGIAIDASGNIYLTGYFEGTADFNPDPTPVTGEYLLTSNGGRDIFVLKLNSAGAFQWAKGIGNSANSSVSDRDFGRSIALDAAANVYVVGSFANTADFNPDPAPAAVFDLTSAGERDVFILLLNSAGDFVLARQIGSTGFDQAESVALNPLAGNIHVTGFFVGTVDFDIGAGTLNLTSNSGSQDAFILKLSQLIVTPLVLTQFTGKPANQAVQLNWSTASEANTLRFEIQKSRNGTQFTPAGTIPAGGHSSTARNYSFTDHQPFGDINYYRLKMIDADGQFQYSKIVAVRLNDSRDLQVFPNPARNTLYVQVAGNDPNSILRISDAYGRVLKEQKLALSGTVSTTIDVSSLPSGIYYLTVQDSSKTRKYKIMKQ